MINYFARLSVAFYWEMHISQPDNKSTHQNGRQLLFEIEGIGRVHCLVNQFTLNVSFFSFPLVQLTWSSCLFFESMTIHFWIVWVSFLSLFICCCYYYYSVCKMRTLFFALMSRNTILVHCFHAISLPSSCVCLGSDSMKIIDYVLCSRHNTR